MDKKLEDILNAQGVSVCEYGLSAPATIREHIEQLEALREKFGEDAYLVADAGYNNITHEIKTPEAIENYKKELQEKEMNKIRKKRRKREKRATTTSEKIQKWLDLYEINL